jgi:hypothetical protein
MQRFDLMHDAKYEAIFQARTWIWTGALLAGFSLPMALTIFFAARHQIPGAILSFVVAIGSIVTAARLISRRLYAPIIWRLARRKGLNLCVQCGYWLQGLDPDSPRCPECGKKTGSEAKESQEEQCP